MLEARERLENHVANTQEELETIKSEISKINRTLNVLQRHREKGKDETQQSLSNEFEAIVLPLFDKLHGASRNRRQPLRLVDLVEDNLKNLMKSMAVLTILMQPTESSPLSRPRSPPWSNWASPQ